MYYAINVFPKFHLPTTADVVRQSYPPDDNYEKKRGKKSVQNDCDLETTIEELNEFLKLHARTPSVNRVFEITMQTSSSILNKLQELKKLASRTVESDFEEIIKEIKGNVIKLHVYFKTDYQESSVLGIIKKEKIVFMQVKLSIGEGIEKQSTEIKYYFRVHHEHGRQYTIDIKKTSAAAPATPAALVAAPTAPTAPATPAVVTMVREGSSSGAASGSSKAKCDSLELGACLLWNPPSCACPEDIDCDCAC